MSFVKNVGLTLAANLGVTLLSLGTGVLLARTLGPGGRGLMTTLLLWPTMLTWAGGLGLSHANIYFGAREPQTRRRLFANSFWAALALGVVVGGVSAVFLPHVVHLTAQTRWLLAFGLLCLPLSMWGDCMTGLLQGASRFHALAVVRVVAPVVTAALLLGCFATHRLTVATAVLATWGAGWLGMALVLRCLVRDEDVGFRPDFPLLRRSFAYAGRVQVGNLASLANGRMDQLLMTAVVAPKALGLYAFAVTLTELLTQIASSIAAVLVPKVAGEAGQEPAAEIAARSARWVLILGCLGALVLNALAPLLIRGLWGERFLESLPTIRVLLPGTVLMGVGATLTAGLRGTGQPMAGTLTQFASLGLMIPLLLFWLPRLGIYGAGLASTVGYAAGCLVACLCFARTFGAACLMTALRPTGRDWRDACGLLRRTGRQVQRQWAATEA